MEKVPPSLELGSYDSQPSDGNANNATSINTASTSDDHYTGPQLTLERRHGCYRMLYWTTRYFLVSTSFYLAFITTLYGVSNLITIDAVNFFCDIYSREEVLAHNQKEELNEGDGDSCYKINRLSFNDDAVQELDLDLYDATFKGKKSGLDILAFIVCLLLVVFLLFIGTQNLYFVIYDTVYFYHFKKFNPRIAAVHEKWGAIRRKQKQQAKQKNPQNDAPTDVFGIVYYIYTVGYGWYLNFYDKYFYFDSKWKIASIISGEVFEILVQLYALLLYGGINLFDSNNIPLGQESSVIISFSIIIGVNSILAGIGWLIYALWHDTWHGTLFFCLLFFIDTTFEIIYTLFPLIYLTPAGTKSIFDTRSLGLLKQSNPFVMLQILSAIIFLVNKSWHLMSQLDPSYIEDEYYHNINRIKIKKYASHEPWIITQEWVKYQRTTKHALQLKQIQMQQQQQQQQQEPQQKDKTQREAVVFPFVDSLLSMIRQEFKNVELTTPSHMKQTTLRASSVSVRSEPQTPNSVSLSRDTITIFGMESLETDHDNSNKNENCAIEVMIDEGKNTNKQVCRKWIIVFVSLILMGIGATVLGMFIQDIETNYNAKCIDQTDQEWLGNHTEIEVIYKPFCKRKSVNLFNTEYPCNCRQFKLDHAHTNELELELIINNLENVFRQWSMLEAFYVSINKEDMPGLASMSFSEKEVKLPHLRIFNTHGISIDYIDDSISQNMKKLEVLIITDSNVAISFSWQSISEIESIKALKFADNTVGVPPLDNNICNLTNIRYFAFTHNGVTLNINDSNSDIPDCIENGWKNLQSISMGVPFEDNIKSYISPNLYTLPNIRSITILGWPFNISSFENFTSFNKQSLIDKNNNTYVWFSSSDICKDVTSTSGDDDSTWLDYIAKKTNNTELLLFINQFTPCFEPCEIGSGCTLFNWGDGICDQRCFSSSCGWDNGDCAQLCECLLDGNENTTNLLLDDTKCDEECNTEMCLYDYDACLNENGTCINQTVSEDDMCYNGWLGDGWCDTNCRAHSSCDRDHNDCSGCGSQSNCEFIFNLFRVVSGGGTIITQNQTCDKYYLAEDLAAEAVDNFTNCSILFHVLDTNDNNVVGFHEFIMGVISSGLFDWTENYKYDLKQNQIDCSMCMQFDNQTLYYI